jgi:hypothetical protein
MNVMQHGWNLQVPHTDKAKKLVAKLKNLRRVLKEYIDLSLDEWNFRNIIRENDEKLL